jgi:hypothetical protein
LLDHPAPTEADPEGRFFAYEKGLGKTGAGEGSPPSGSMRNCERRRGWCALAVAVLLLGSGTVVSLARGSAPTPPFTPCVVNGVAIATPAPSSSKVDLSDIEGGKEYVIRAFAVSGIRLVGTLGLQFVSVRFENPDHAHEAFAVLGDRFVAAIEGDASGVRRASADRMGDESVAYVGTVRSIEPEPDEVDSLVVALAVVRTGAILRIGVGFSLATDPLTDTVETLAKAVDRQPSAAAPTCDADGLHHGGLWDTLPTLDDLPTGFVLDEESSRVE